MADLFSMLGRAVRALDAQRFGLDVAGQNITNVNTPGYVRRSAVLAESDPVDPFGPGGGVDVVAVTSARAPLIEARLQYEQPAASREQEIAERLAVVESGLGDPGASLDETLARFYNTYATLASSPTSSTARQQVIVQGQSLAKGFNDMATRFQTARLTADHDLGALVAQVNALASQLSDLNKQISATGGENVAGLLDQQSVVIGEIGKLADVHAITHEDGSIDLSIGNGRALVIGDRSFDLSVTISSTDGAAHVMTDGAAVTTDLTTEITGGRIGGLIYVRDTLLPSYVNQLDQLAYTIATDINALATSGYDLDGNAGVAFFTPPAAVAGAAAQLSVNASVAANNRLVVTAATTSPGDNDVAKAIAALQDTAMTGTTSRPVDGWGGIVYKVGNDARTAKQAQESHEQITQQLRNLRDQVSGVSLDEEAAMLMRFQRAYEANARFFTVADQMLDVLLSIGGK
jgi:flagellar hook-associated protein 1 FlgK